QRVWQVLPLGPTGYGDSPYQSFSAFAGNPLLISLDLLIEQGLLEHADLPDSLASQPGTIDYDAVIAHRRGLWPRVLDRFESSETARQRFDQYCDAQSAWLDDFALFMALKDAHAQVAWTKWEADIASRKPDAVTQWSNQLAREIRVHKLTQFL